MSQGGSLALVDSPTTRNVNGDLTIGNNAQLLVTIDPAQDNPTLVSVSGKTLLNGGSMLHVGQNGNYRPLASYTIIESAGGVEGTCSSVSSNYAFLDPLLAYSPNDVTLFLRRNDLNFGDLANTPNQREAGDGAQSVGEGGIYDVILGLPRDRNVVGHALDQISGEYYASIKTALIEDSRFVREAANNRLLAAFGHNPTAPQAVAAGLDDDDLTMWGQGFGPWGSTGGNNGTAKLDRDTHGLLLGADKLVYHNWLVGVIGGVSSTDVDVDARRSTGSGTNYHLGVYGGNQWDKLALRSTLAYSWHDIDSTRTPRFAGFSDRDSGDYRGNTVQAATELGYTVQVAFGQLEPFVNLTYVNLHTNGFNERGGAAALNVHSDNTDATFTTLGLRSATPSNTQAFRGGDAFQVAGAPVAKDAALVELGIDVAVAANAQVGVAYGGQFGGNSNRDQSAMARFNWKF